jgi:hypothetical protein
MYTIQESGGNRTLLQFPSRSDTLPVTVQYDSDSSSDDSSTTSSHSKGDRKHHHKQHNSSTSKLQTTLLRPLSGFGDAWRLMTTGNSNVTGTSNQHAPHGSAETDGTNGQTPADVGNYNADATTPATADATGSVDNDSTRAVLQTSKTCVIS